MPSPRRGLLPAWAPLHCATHTPTPLPVPIPRSTDANGHWLGIKNELVVSDLQSVILMEEAERRKDMGALLASMDCYVSLSHTEALGLDLLQVRRPEAVYVTAGCGVVCCMPGAVGVPRPQRYTPLAPYP